jgi:hypothetical protein
MWLLAGSATVRTLVLLNLASGQLAAPVPESASAVAVAQTATGDVAVGLAAGTTGAVEIRQGAAAQLTRTVPVGAPVRAIVTGSDGTTLFVLNASATSASVAVIPDGAAAPTGTLPVPSDADAIAAAPGDRFLYVAQPSGVITVVPTAPGQPSTSFATGTGARALAVSSDGERLYVLKGTAGTDNVAVVALRTEVVTSVLPAADPSVGLAISPDGTELYDVVGSPTVGNVQVIHLPPAGP